MSMSNQSSKALQNNKLLMNVNFADLDLSEINGDLISKNAGEIIYREGEAANAVFLVVSGEINLVNKGANENAKSQIFSENTFFGNIEFFEDEKRRTTAVALKDCYLIKLSEDEVHNLIQQDTTIYENLRQLAEERFGVEPEKADSAEDLDDIDMALKMDSELEGINFDTLPEEKPADLMGKIPEETFAPGETAGGNTDFSPDANVSGDELDDDIMKALEAEDSFDSMQPPEPSGEGEKESNEDFSLSDDEFFKNFQDTPDETASEIGTTPPPPVVPPTTGSKNANDLINFNFDDKNSEPDLELPGPPLPDEEAIDLKAENFDEMKPEDNIMDEPEINLPEEEPEKSEQTPEPGPADDTKEEILTEINAEKEKRINLGKAKEGESMTPADLEMINKAAQLVNSNIQLDEVLQNIVDVARNLTGADRGTLYLVDKENNELWSKVLIGDNLKEVRLKIGEGVAGWVAESKETVNVENVKEDKRFQPAVDKDTGYETKTMLCFPIKNREDDIVGVLQLLNSGNGKFSKLDEEFLNALSIHAALALENANNVQNMLQNERVDSLGKMANFLIQDIKKPVLVSKRYAEHLRGKDLPPEVLQVLDMMLEQMNAVADLVQTTSSYAEGKKILHTMVVDVAETLEDFAGRMEQFVQLKTCAIVNSLEIKAKVKLDVKEFFQCYSHMIKNACDAMPDGGRITVSAMEKGDSVLIYVQDEGLGIPDTIKEKIFEPFTTHGKKEGTGLGLAITKKTVEAHGGTISVESTIGEGATFVIKLPAQK